MHSIKQGDRQFRDDLRYNGGFKGVLAIFFSGSENVQTQQS